MLIVTRLTNATHYSTRDAKMKFFECFLLKPYTTLSTLKDRLAKHEPRNIPAIAMNDF